MKKRKRADTLQLTYFKIRIFLSFTCIHIHYIICNALSPHIDTPNHCLTIKICLIFIEWAREWRMIPRSNDKTITLHYLLLLIFRCEFRVKPTIIKKKLFRSECEQKKPWWNCFCLRRTHTVHGAPIERISIYGPMCTSLSLSILYMSHIPTWINVIVL